MNPYHDPKSGRFTGPSRGGGGGGASLQSGATNKAGSKSVTMTNSALAKTSSKSAGKRLTKEQRKEVERDIRMEGPFYKPGKRTLRQGTYRQTLLKEKRIKDTYRQWNIKAANATTKAERTLAKASAKAWKKANPGLL